MKTSLLVLFISSVFLATACTPRDQEVVSSDQRNQILNQKNRKGGGYSRSGGSSKDQVQLGSYGLAAFMLEKQGEVLQIVSTSRLAQTQRHGFFVVNEASSDQQDYQKLSVAAINQTRDFAGFESVRNSQWDLYVQRDAQHSIRSVLGYLTGSSVVRLSQSGVDVANGQAVVLSEDGGNIEVTPAEDPSQTAVSFFAQGSLKITKDKISEVLPYRIQIHLIVSTVDFQEDILKIQKGDVGLDLVRGGGSKFDVKIVNKGEVSFRNGDCPAVLGTAVIDSDRSKKQVTLDENGASVSKSSYKAPTAACGQRPLVDLSRILIY